MSGLHSHDNTPVNNAETCETTRPDKECPICGEETGRLPMHIAKEHGE